MVLEQIVIRGYLQEIYNTFVSNLVKEHVKLFLPIRTSQQIFPLRVSQQLCNGPHKLALIKPDV